MSRIINFKELCDLVANIDYLWTNSYPVVFTVENEGERTEKYQAGIDDTIEEYQYLSVFGNLDDEKPSRLLDRQDPDAMVYSEICQMLKEECEITDNSVIKLIEDKSFTGELCFKIIP